MEPKAHTSLDPTITSSDILTPSDDEIICAEFYKNNSCMVNRSILCSTEVKDMKIVPYSEFANAIGLPGIINLKKIRLDLDSVPDEGAKVYVFSVDGKIYHGEVMEKLTIVKYAGFRFSFLKP